MEYLLPDDHLIFFFLLKHTSSQELLSEPDLPKKRQREKTKRCVSPCLSLPTQRRGWEHPGVSPSPAYTGFRLRVPLTQDRIRAEGVLGCTDTVSHMPVGHVAHCPVSPHWNPLCHFSEDGISPWHHLVPSIANKQSHAPLVSLPDTTEVPPLIITNSAAALPFSLPTEL